MNKFTEIFRIPGADRMTWKWIRQRVRLSIGLFRIYLFFSNYSFYNLVLFWFIYYFKVISRLSNKSCRKKSKSRRTRNAARFPARNFGYRFFSNVKKFQFSFWWLPSIRLNYICQSRVCDKYRIGYCEKYYLARSKFRDSFLI